MMNLSSQLGEFGIFFCDFWHVFFVVFSQFLLYSSQISTSYYLFPIVEKVEKYRQKLTKNYYTRRQKDQKSSKRPDFFLGLLLS